MHNVRMPSAALGGRSLAKSHPCSCTRGATGMHCITLQHPCHLACWSLGAALTDHVPLLMHTIRCPHLMRPFSACCALYSSTA